MSEYDLLHESHAAGGTVYTLCADGTVRGWSPGEPFEPSVIVVNASRNRFARWLDEVVLKSGISRADGWIGSISVNYKEFADEGAFAVAAGWFLNDKDPLLGPAMSFGAAFHKIAREHREEVMLLMQNEFNQLLLDRED
jgi:hypothetical protein